MKKLYLLGLLLLMFVGNKVNAATTVINTSGCSCCVHPFTLDSNGGEFSNLAASYNNITDVAQLPIVEREGYTFDGWFKKIGSYYYKLTNSNLNQGDKICCSACPNASETVYYASWVKIPVEGDAPVCRALEGGCFSTTITFDTNNGESLEEMRSCTSCCETNVTPTTVLPIPVKSGYTFDGWYYDSTYETKVIDNTFTAVVDGKFFEGEPYSLSTFGSGENAATKFCATQAGGRNSITLYAKWLEQEVVNPKTGDIRILIIGITAIICVFVFALLYNKKIATSNQ